MNNNETNESQDWKRKWTLKLREPKVSAKNPWGDDKLAREKVADALTEVIEYDPNSLVISLSGEWGTGKTFLLKRWQKSLEKKDFKSIYFNAWEDDFYDDPLVAIIGQLLKELGKNNASEISVDNVREEAKRFFKLKNIVGLAEVVGNLAGVNIPLKKLLEDSSDKTLDLYDQQSESRIKLTKELKKMTKKIWEKKKRPLIFIIDELDRCRPTFAIELLERVKHIFNISHIVFVFGVNRAQLCKSIKSIYGEIDTDVYLRRFFDMEFLLPTPDKKKFCEHVMNQYELSGYFRKLSKQHEKNKHLEEYKIFQKCFPTFCGYLDLSLRDIDYCVRYILFVGKSVKNKYIMLPILVSALIILRLKSGERYRKFICGKLSGGKIIDYFDEIKFDQSRDNKYNEFMDILEVELYSTENDGGNSLKQFQSLHSSIIENHLGIRTLFKRSSKDLDDLSKRTVQELNVQRIDKLYSLMKRREKIERGFKPLSIKYLSSLIELSGEERN